MRFLALAFLIIWGTACSGGSTEPAPTDTGTATDQATPVDAPTAEDTPAAEDLSTQADTPTAEDTPVAEDTPTGEDTSEPEDDAINTTDTTACVPAPEKCNGNDDDCDGAVDNVSCNDNNECTEDTCGGVAGCVFTATPGETCNDGLLLTQDDQCTEDGQCAGTEDPCPPPPAACTFSCDCPLGYTFENGCSNTSTDINTWSFCNATGAYGACTTAVDDSCNYTPKASNCGDGICDLTEHCANCVADCGGCNNPGNNCHAQMANILESEIPITGFRVPAFDDLDQDISDLMEQYAVPGLNVAIMKDNKLVYARGFGFSKVRKEVVEADDPPSDYFNTIYQDSTTADRVHEWVHPDTVFRICSISKGVTAAAVLHLHEAFNDGLPTPPGVEICNVSTSCNGLVDHRPFAEGGLLQNLSPLPGGSTVHPDLQKIRVKHLLRHTAGFSRSCPGCDDYFKDKSLNVDVAEWADLSTTYPGAKDLLRHIITKQPYHLQDYDPGDVYEYSNTGYVILAQLIRAATDLDYEDYVKEHILEPGGVNDMFLGRTLESQRAENEADYYVHPHKKLFSSWWPDITGSPVEYTDGGFHLELYKGTGSWVTGAVDMLRYVSVIDNDGVVDEVLSQDSFDKYLTKNKCPSHKYKVDKSTTPPSDNYAEFDSADCAGDTDYYTMGWNVRETDGTGSYKYARAGWNHTGSLNGSRTYVYRRDNGVSWTLLGNTAPPETAIDSSSGVSPWDTLPGDWDWYDKDQYTRVLAYVMNKHTDTTSDWPNHDLFDQYKNPSAWKTASEFQDFYVAKIAAGKWATRIEAKEVDGQLKYRGRFATKLPLMTAHARHGSTCANFKSAHQEYSADGFELVSMQAVVHEGTRYYQGVWTSPVPSLGTAVPVAP